MVEFLLVSFLEEGFLTEERRERRSISVALMVEVQSSTCTKMERVLSACSPDLVQGEADSDADPRQPAAGFQQGRLPSKTAGQ